MIAIPERSLPGQSREARLFWKIRFQILRTLARQAIFEARLRTSLILLLTIGFWFGMMFVFLEGFQIVTSMISHEGTRVETTHAIFNVFFLSLLGMLTMSSAIILYSSLYRSRETRFLLTTPARVRRIAWYKFQETLLLSCWGFFLLGSPLLVAYGVVSDSPWYYYASFLPFMIAFAFIPVTSGAILCILFVRYFPRYQRQLLALIATLLVLAGIVGIWSFLQDIRSGQAMSFEWFQNTLSRLQYAEQRWFPSWWLSSGLLECAHPADSRQQSSWAESLGFFCVLSSNAMALYLLLGYVAERHYVAGLCSLAASGSNRKHVSGGWIDRGIHWITSPFPTRMRLLLMKDIRVFRRDILQWSQVAIFFSLLCFYFINARRIQYDGAPQGWMMVVGYLNVSVVGLLLATFTTRFIYPLISLEGRKFWILGTLPIERKDILFSKFLFATGMSVAPCCALVLLSDLMLKLQAESPWILVIHQLTIISLCIGLAGLAVGMGARLPNLRESSPSKLASGFGGTLTLVLSVAYILACILVSAIPTCAWVNSMNRSPEFLYGRHPLALGSLSAVLVGQWLMLMLCMAATWLPIRSGLKSFNQLEPL